MLTAEFKKGTGSERPFLAGLLPFGFSECRAAVGRFRTVVSSDCLPEQVVATKRG